MRNVPAGEREYLCPTVQGERERTVHCDASSPSPPGPPHSLPALGWGCLRRSGALPLTPTRDAVPGPCLGSWTLRTHVLGYLSPRAQRDTHPVTRRFQLSPVLRRKGRSARSRC
jgi:hypothetical protein